MENAVKALLMAAGVLIGVLILSLGVTLYSALSSYADEIHEDIEKNALDKFNTQFTAYIRDDLTIQDIVTVANIAYENNNKYLLNSSSAGNENTNYVQVQIGEDSIEVDIHDNATELLKTYLKDTFTCTSSNIRFSNITGRVMSIKFVKNTI